MYMLDFMLMDEAGDGGGGGGSLATGGGMPNPGAPELAPSNGPQLPALPENWYEGLDEDIRNEPSIKNFKDVNALAKSLVHAQKHVGADKLVKPGKDASVEDLVSFLRQAGAPEEKDAYDYKSETGYADEQFMDSFKNAAHAAGLLPHQFRGIMEWYEGQMAEQVKSFNQKAEMELSENTAKLQAEWGQAYEARMATVGRFLRENASEALLNEIDDSGIGNSVEFNKLMYKAANEVYGEDAISGKGAGRVGLDPSEAQAKIDAIQGDMSHPYWKGDKAAVAEMEKLIQATVVR